MIPKYNFVHIFEPYIWIWVCLLVWEFINLNKVIETLSRGAQHYEFPNSEFSTKTSPHIELSPGLLLLSIWIFSTFYFQPWATLSFQIHMSNCLFDITTRRVNRHFRPHPQQNPANSTFTTRSPHFPHPRKWHQHLPNCLN